MNKRLRKILAALGMVLLLGTVVLTTQNCASGGGKGNSGLGKGDDPGDPSRGTDSGPGD